MEEQSQKVKLIMIMRHGERIDETKLTQLLEIYDPELTDKGINQAIDIGKQIKKNYIKDEIKSINLYSSPYTRTLMTGLNVISQINQDKKTNILLVKGLSEINTLAFNYDPANTLLINNKENKIELYNKFINYKEKFEYIKDGDIIPKYPESFNDGKDRYRKIAKILFEQINNNNENSLHIIVSHAYGVEAITQEFMKKCPNCQDLLYEDDLTINYCTTFCFNYINNNMEYLGTIETKI